MTSRMVTIAVICALLLCLLLFLLGMEIGAHVSRSPTQSADALRAAPAVVSVAPQPGAAAQSSLDAGDLAAAPALSSSTP